MAYKRALHHLRGALLTSVLAAAAAAHAEPQKFTTIAPIFSQLLVVSQPANFVPAFEKAVPERYLRESVPKGETVDHWTQMITVTGAKGLANNRDITPESFAGLLANGFKKSCPGSFSSKALGKLHVGTFDGFAAVAGCGSYTSGDGARGETALIVTIRGAQDYYTIQWAERSAPIDQPPALDDATWMQRLHDLGPVRLCPIVAGEQAPYPSCVAG